MINQYLSILRQHKHPIRFVLARLLVLSGLCRYIIIPQKGYRMRFHPANLSTNLWIDPSYRVEPLAFFNAYLKPRDFVIDVGANVGDTVLTSSDCIGPKGHVIGIEAHPRTFGFLEENIKLNKAKNVTLIHAAAGEKRGKVTISDSRYDDMNQVNHGTLEVRINRLDDLVTTSLPIALLKVDVEGFERPVFQGASRILSQTDCVYFEVGDQMCCEFGYTARDLLGDIGAHGYHMFIHTANGSLSPLTGDQVFTPYQNVVATRDVAQLRARTGWAVIA